MGAASPLPNGCRNIIIIIILALITFISLIRTGVILPVVRFINTFILLKVLFKVITFVNKTWA